MSEKKREFEVGDSYNKEIAELDLNTRKDTLNGLAYSVQEEGYTKVLKDSDITDKREELSDVCIEINEIEEEKKEVTAAFALQLKEPKLIRGTLLQAIKHKSEFRKGILYYVDDQESGFMYVFDEDAECVESRPLRPTERQAKIRTINQEVSNG